jgi:hypothetical protein
MVSAPSRPVLRIAFGLFLLVNPLYIDAFHLDQPSWYRYEATEVSYGEDGLEFDIHADGIDDDVACLRENLPTRACALERAVYERGNLTVPVGWGRLISLHGPYGYEYVYVNDSFYRAEAREVGGETILSLSHTPADVAMRDVATSMSAVSPEIRTAVQSGSVKLRRELDGANRLVRDGDTYYVVYRAAAHVQNRSGITKGRVLETALTGLGIAVGLGQVLRGQRERVERESRK